MKIRDLFNQTWSEETQNFADVMTSAILEEETPRLHSVQHAAVFRELLCEAITNNSPFELTDENEEKLISIAAIYSALISMNADGDIIIAEDAEGEEILVFRG